MKKETVFGAIFTCTFCDIESDTKKGLKIYVLQSALKRAQVIENNKTYNKDIIDENVYSWTQEQTDTMLVTICKMNFLL